MTQNPFLPLLPQTNSKIGTEPDAYGINATAIAAAIFLIAAADTKTRIRNSNSINNSIKAIGHQRKFDM